MIMLLLKKPYFVMQTLPKCFQKDAEFLCSTQSKDWNENLEY